MSRIAYPRGKSAPTSTKPPSALDTALDLLGRGFWPVAIYPPGVKLPKRTTKGKEPIGENWGIERWDEKRLAAPLSGSTPRPESEPAWDLDAPLVVGG